MTMLFNRPQCIYFVSDLFSSFLNWYKHPTSIIPSGKKSLILGLSSAREYILLLVFNYPVLSFDPYSRFWEGEKGERWEHINVL